MRRLPGVTKLKEMALKGELLFPAIIVNDFVSKLKLLKPCTSRMLEFECSVEMKLQPSMELQPGRAQL